MKNNFSKYNFLIFLFVLLFVGCGGSSPSNDQQKTAKIFQIDPKTFPALPSAQKVEDGIIMYKIRLNKDDESSDVWIYLPEKQTKEKIPGVLIAAAGSYLFNGVSIGEGDQPEHLPYVRKGYAVIAYETPGSLKEANNKKLTNEQLRTAAAEFKDSNAGLVQEQNALSYALEKVSAIDAEKIYSAGHSSAATLSLLVAANEPRVKAAIAYAPATNVEKKLSDDLDLFERLVPDFKNFIVKNSPINNISKIKIPVFIFQANDDSVIPVEDTKTLVEELKKVNPNVTFIIVNEGDHYDSMIQQGIPKGIEWLNKIAFGNKTK